MRTRGALAPCRARSVDPASRSDLAVASFRDLGDSRVRAEIRKRLPQHEAWVEIVGDASRPVISAKLRHMRRAMRWADAALRRRAADVRAGGRGVDQAGRRGLGPLRRGVGCGRATRTARTWRAAREVAMYPGVEVRSEPPSPWAKELASRTLMVEEPFLAEKVT